MPLRRRGYRKYRIRSARTTNEPKPQASSLASGAIGLRSVSGAACSSSSSPPSSVATRRTATTASVTDTTAVSTSTPHGTGERSGSGELQEDEHHEADQGERLGEGDAQEHRGAHHAGRFGLAGHRLDRLADEVTDADAG